MATLCPRRRTGSRDSRRGSMDFLRQEGHGMRSKILIWRVRVRCGAERPAVNGKSSWDSRTLPLNVPASELGIYCSSLCASLTRLGREMLVLPGNSSCSNRALFRRICSLERPWHPEWSQLRSHNHQRNAIRSQHSKKSIFMPMYIPKFVHEVAYMSNNKVSWRSFDLKSSMVERHLPSASATSSETTQERAYASRLCLITVCSI
jgi:hypothetical protein